MLGDRRPYLVALLTADESLAGAARRGRAACGQGRGRRPSTRRWPTAEQIRRFAVLDEDFTPAGGELTPTLKVRRRLVEERYAELIAGLYERSLTGPGSAFQPASLRTPCPSGA